MGPTFVHVDPVQTYKLPEIVYESPRVPVGCAACNETKSAYVPSIATPVPAVPCKPNVPCEPMVPCEPTVP